MHNGFGPKMTIDGAFRRACNEGDFATVKRIWKIVKDDEPLVYDGLVDAVDHGHADVALYIKEHSDTWDSEIDDDIANGRTTFVHPALIAVALGEDYDDDNM